MTSTPATLLVLAAGALALRSLSAAPGTSERDRTVLWEVSAEDLARAASLDRGVSRAEVDAAPARVARQLADSRALHITPAAWEIRRRRLREEFLKAALLWPLPARGPLNPIIHGRREYDGYSVENIAIEAMPGFYCTGNVYRPLGASARGPGILCPHGHFRPLGRFREEHQLRCAHLARMGATVLSYAMVGWNDSRQTSHRDPFVLPLQMLNGLAALDWLAAQPGVDPARLGVAGASGGGTQALFLALIDERVAASCPVGIVYPWTDELGCLCEGGLPVMREARTNAIELAAATAPRAQLLISIGGDGTREFPQNGFPFIRSIYELTGHADRVANVHLADEFHDFGPSKRRATYSFFARHLGLTDRPEVAATITIEIPRQMEVFGPTHPLPAAALRGAEEVGRAFLALPRTGAGR